MFTFLDRLLLVGKLRQCGGRERLHKATGVHSGDVSQLALHSSHHQTEYSFGGRNGGLDENECKLNNSAISTQLNENLNPI
ncbi:MAG: hypothetical protein V7K67_05255 [Nostoc sp.]|uniref:hypothetical protein n=1 Tax=Nostoc sp. TaxID=1180 RepID=UPI002FF9BE4C